MFVAGLLTAAALHTRLADLEVALREERERLLGALRERDRLAADVAQLEHEVEQAHSRAAAAVQEALRCQQRIEDLVATMKALR